MADIQVSSLGVIDLELRLIKPLTHNLIPVVIYRRLQTPEDCWGSLKHEEGSTAIYVHTV